MLPVPIPETLNLSNMFFTGLLSTTIRLSEPKFVVGRSDCTYVSSEGVKVRIVVDAGVVVGVMVYVGVLDGVIPVAVLVAVGVLVTVTVIGVLVIVAGGAESDKVWITS